MATDCLDIPATPRAPAPAPAITLAEARQLRTQAVQLLQTLIVDRDGSDQRHMEAGKRDPLRIVTGKSALDQAIASAQDMIFAMDTMIANMTGEVAVESSMSIDPPIIETRPLDQRRPGFRRTLRTALNASFRTPPVPAVS